MRIATVFFTAAALVIVRPALAGPYSDYNATGHGIDAAIPAKLSGKINPIFKSWAGGYEKYLPAAGVSPAGSVPTSALGVADNVTVSLGDLDQEQIDAGVACGEITLTFGNPIYNGSGADFAVFENSAYYSGWGFFGELGYVEVSSNGVDFVRFECVSTNAGPVGPYGVIDSTNIYNLVGKHEVFYGTPFDLVSVAVSEAVAGGLVDINNIRYVKIVDIPGSGDFADSLGNSIYDAWITRGTGGVDLDAIGAINIVPEPGALRLLAGLFFVLSAFRYFVIKSKLKNE